MSGSIDEPLVAIRRSSLNEWHTLVVGLQGALVTGFIYAYSTYSNALQNQLHLSESDKELIGLAPSITNLFTTMCGLTLDRTSVRFCLMLSTVLMSGSYIVYGLVGLKIITVSGTVPLCFALSAMGSLGASFVVACVFSTLAKNFEAAQRSAVVSIAKAWVGVAAGVGTSIYIGLFPDDGGSERLRFLFFVAVICGVVPLAIRSIAQLRSDGLIRFSGSQMASRFTHQPYPPPSSAHSSTYPLAQRHPPTYRSG